MLIAPSILNANNLKLEQVIKKGTDCGITRFHIDIMDGHFVPNLSFGPQLVHDFKREFPFIDAEIHLMSDQPARFVPAFAAAGADIVELHYEAMSEKELDQWLSYLTAHEIKAGLALSPDTPISVLNKYSKKIDQVLLMTVKPGFGGQSFISKSEERIKAASELLQAANAKVPIEVDGGINAQTIKIAKEAGASIFVVGSYIFENGDIASQIDRLARIIG